MLAKASRSLMALRANRAFMPIAQRTYLADLGLDSNSLVAMEDENKKAGQVALWKEQVENKNALALSNQDEIEKYVISLVRDYFRTTQKAAVSLDSKFTDHGLDSLDTIELVIQVEDELGYLIDAEKLELFKKPKHFVNYISQMEAYKTEAKRLPEDGIHEDFEWKKHFPGLPSLGHWEI